MKPLYLLAPMVLLAGISMHAAGDGPSDARLQPLEAWFNRLREDARGPVPAAQVSVAPVPAPQAPATSPEARFQPIEAWFASLPKPSASAVPAGQATVPAAPASPVAEHYAASGLALKLDRVFDSLKYVVFFTPGSARLGPNGQRTVRLLAPKARKADQVTVWSHSDKSGDPALNEILKRKRADAIVTEFRRRGAGNTVYSVAIEPAGQVLAVPPDAKAVWRPADAEGLQRRALIDVQTARAASAK